MKPFLVKLVYQIVCGDGGHRPQFDEQIRLVFAGSNIEALEKSKQLGYAEEVTFSNKRNELVRWEFVVATELYQLEGLTNGAEVCSRIFECDDASNYIDLIKFKNSELYQKCTLNPV